jgi:hypothetical protein
VRRFILAFGAIPILAACADILGPRIPTAAVRIEPLPVYAEWWRMTEQCSGRTGEFRRIEWYVMPGVSGFSSGDLAHVQGMITGNRIVIADSSLRHGRLVRHEMLHALIGVNGHPRADFIGRCGLIVACQGPCPSEAEAPPAPDLALSVPDSALDVTASVWPSSPSDSILGGYFRLTISARNPHNHPIVVQLAPSGDAGPPVAFRFRFEQSGFIAINDDRAWFPEMTRFAPGERKDMVYDFWVAPNFPGLYSGTYRFSAGFGDSWAPTFPVTIQPPS